jgi:hypothetical protein
MELGFDSPWERQSAVNYACLFQFMIDILKRPSAWIPIILTLVVTTVWLISIVAFGVPGREADEGIAAHLFQVWLGLEILMIGYFGMKRVPQKPKQAVAILTIQVVLTLAACAPVFYFNL